MNKKLLFVLVGVGFLTLGSSFPVMGRDVIISEVSLGTVTTSSADPRMFTYFPENEVYLSSNPEVYFWKVNGLWNSGSYLPDDIILSDVKKSVMLSGNPSNSSEHKVVLIPQTESKTIMVPQTETTTVTRPETKATTVMVPHTESKTEMVPHTESKTVMRPETKSTTVMVPLTESGSVMVPATKSTTTMVSHTESKTVMVPQTETRILLVPQKTETKFKYIFYPDARVYFDPGTSEYLLQENGAWKIYKTIPPSVTINQSTGEQIFLNEDIRITTIP